jgi:tetratricopeptide (TPR) repeat protein
MGPSFTGPIHEIAADISQFRQRCSALPRYHPRRPICAYRLARALSDRYQLLNQKGDLEKSILYLTESLLLSPLSWLAHGTMILEVLSQLALSLANRSRVSRESEDAIYAAKYLRHLRDPARTPFAFQRQSVTALLVEALALQMALKASDVVQTLEEMAVLTEELLTSDPSSDNSTCASACFTRAVEHKRPELSPDRLLDEIIKCLRLAGEHKPQLRQVQLCLAKCLFIRYGNTLSDELDEAASIVDELIDSSSPGDEVAAECQELLPILTMLRSVGDGRPETSEEAIYRARGFLASSSAEDPLYHAWSRVLEHAAKNRFITFGPIDGLEASSNSDPVPADVGQKTRPLDGLLDGIRNNSITDIEEAIELGRSILASSDPSDLQSSHEFGEILFEAFKRTKNINYLNESIHILRQLVARRPPMILRHWTMYGLLGTLGVRSVIFRGHRTQDLYEMVELIPQYLNDGSRWFGLPHRFHLACTWALFAQEIQHPSASTAYETALSSMQDIASFSPTLQLQHVTLATLPDYSHEMPLAYASYQVERGQLEKAIETLERGRSLLWSEMRRLRTSIDQLLDADPELGHKFATLNRDLEELTKSISPSHELNLDDVIADDLRAGDQFGTFLLRQRGLLKERDKLISQIRALPGFDCFLTFPLFDTLRSAASSGPVIIVNHSKPRSDILILLHNASPSLITTTDDFYDRASGLKDKLLTVRVKDGPDSNQYDEALASVLTELYELVGKPVIERLRTLQVQEKSRIWWCPTSVFCSLPLHAMGPIPSDDGELRYFMDLYISSYTPSLSALIQSRARASDLRSSDRPSVLLVAQSDPSLPTVGGEIQVVQALDTEVTSLISGAATPAAVLDSFQHHRFVHFACHGTLQAGKPFEAGFELYGHERLTLLEIVRSDLPTAEFAFLSACHTAEVTEGSNIDESLHLAAAVQYSGFRSVVGTMWAMVDEDGRDLAENFYRALFSNLRRYQEIPYHERSAKALRFAVKKLQRKRRITLERWVNFVHYGA